MMTPRWTPDLFSQWMAFIPTKLVIVVQVRTSKMQSVELMALTKLQQLSLLMIGVNVSRNPKLESAHRGARCTSGRRSQISTKILVFDAALLIPRDPTFLPKDLGTFQKQYSTCFFDSFRYNSSYSFISFRVLGPQRYTTRTSPVRQGLKLGLGEFNDFV